ncbi:MAG: hypothetical protein ACLFV2_09435 [Desulfurivibrionaceae bacterium]
MKIHLTKKEYRLLLDILSISDWVMTSRKKGGENPKAKPYEDLEQKLLAYAKDFGFKNLVSYHKASGRYLPTVEYEEMGTDHAFIDEFEEEVFWDELAYRLAQRDLLEEKGVVEAKEMDPLERLTEEEEKAAQYDEEFVENGIKKLQIVKE